MQPTKFRFKVSFSKCGNLDIAPLTANGFTYNTNFPCFYLTAPLPRYSVLVAATSYGKMATWQFFVDTKQDRAIFQKLQLDGFQRIDALDYNPVDKRIYWSSGDAIKRMSVTGAGGVAALVR